MTTFFIARVDADSIVVRAQMLDEERGLQGDFCQIVQRGGKFGALRFGSGALCAAERHPELRNRAPCAAPWLILTTRRDGRSVRSINQCFER